MEMTLLQMTQSILSSLNSDNVNSINDTVESQQVADIIKNTYFNIIARASLPEHDQLFQLTPSLDNTLPVLMYVPINISKMEWLKYYDTNVDDGSSLQTDQFGAYSQHDVNTDLVSSGWSTTSTTSNTIGLGVKTFTVVSGQSIFANNTFIATSGSNTMSGTVVSYIGTTLVLNATAFFGSGTFTAWTIAQSNGINAVPGYQYVTILPIPQFLDRVNSFNPTDDDVQTYTFTEANNNFTFYYKNDHTPSYCTVLENYYVLFDSYDNTQDSTLQGEKTMCFGQTVPVFNMLDTFTPDLDLQQFPLLLNEAKSLAFYELKQSTHAKAEQESKRQWSNIQKNKSVINKPTYFDQLSNFGRRPGTGGYALYQRIPN